MTVSNTKSGKTTIAIDVLRTIAKLATLNIPGVNRFSSKPVEGMKSLLKPSQIREGVFIDVRDEAVFADLYVILNRDVNIREVSRNIQYEVARAISDMVGLQVGHINIHIEDIDYSVDSKT